MMGSLCLPWYSFMPLPLDQECRVWTLFQIQDTTARLVEDRTHMRKGGTFLTRAQRLCAVCRYCGLNAAVPCEWIESPAFCSAGDCIQEAV